MKMSISRSNDNYKNNIKWQSFSKRNRKPVETGNQSKNKHIIKHKKQQRQQIIKYTSNKQSN